MRYKKISCLLFGLLFVSQAAFGMFPATKKLTPGGAKYREAKAAIERGDLNKLRMMVNRGLDINIRGSIIGENTRSLLHVALQKNINEARRKNIIRFLLEKRINIHSKDERGQTALFYAAVHRSNPELVTILLSGRAQINSQDGDGNTALHHVVNNSNMGMVKFLLSKGANKNIRNRVGKTPLQLAKDFANLAKGALREAEAVAKALERGSRI